MPAQPTTSSSNSAFITASILALVLCAGLAVGGWLATQRVRLLPSVALPAPRAVPSTAALTRPRPIITEESGPSWGSLTSSQQQALEPLQQHWATLTEAQKRKWVSLAGGFQKLSPANQAKMRDRMAAWAALTPEQRNRARLNFAATRKITAPAKQEQWDAYQALSDEAKRALAARGISQVQGAAIAVRPAPDHKFVRVPAADAKAGANTPNVPKVLPPVVDLVPVPVAAPTSAPEPSANGPAPIDPAHPPAQAEPVPMPSATVTELPPLPEEPLAAPELSDNPPSDPVAPDATQDPEPVAQ